MSDKFSYPVNEVLNVTLGLYHLEFSLRDDGFSIKIHHEDCSEIYDISEDLDTKELSFRFTTDHIEKNFLAGNSEEEDIIVKSFEIPQFSITIIVDEDQHLNLHLKENNYKFEQDNFILNKIYATINLLFK